LADAEGDDLIVEATDDCELFEGGATVDVDGDSGELLAGAELQAAVRQIVAMP
jgi:hypothetical protein